MSSSELAPTPGAFVPDVPSGGPRLFEPEAVVVERAKPKPADDPVELEEYRPGPSEEEIRAECRAEMEAELAATLAERRQQDAEHFETFVSEMRESAERRHEELSRRAAELALLIAQRLVRDRIDRDPTVIERILVDAIQTIGRAQGVVVRAHPDDAAYLRSQPERLEKLGVAEVVDDPHQQRGGCFVDAGTDGWDLTFVTQMSHVQEAVDKALRSP